MAKITFTQKERDELMKLKGQRRVRRASEMLGFPIYRQKLDYHLNKQDNVRRPEHDLPYREKKQIHKSNESMYRQERYEEFQTEKSKVEELEKQVFDRVLIISDVHAPYNHKDLLDYLRDLKSIVKPDLAICTGDELDNHAISFHTSDPDLDSAGIELNKGRKVLQELASIFPELYLPHSNHGDLPYRRSKAFGLPKHMIMSYKDIIFAERDEYGNVKSGNNVNWFWADKIIFDTPQGKVKVIHGQDTCDLVKSIKDNHISIVRGHWHSRLNIEYVASHCDLRFGMTVGCGVDEDSYAFAYNKTFNAKFIISAGLVINGYPRVVPMPMDDEGNYLGIKALRKVIGEL